MSKLALLIFCLLIAVPGFSQATDSLFVKQWQEGWIISHKLRGGETVFSLARRYHVPPMMLAEFNDISFQQDLSTYNRLFIPLGAFNLADNAAALPEGALPLYYKADGASGLKKLAERSRVSARTMQKWNNLSGDEIEKGRVLVIGWLIHDLTNNIAKRETEQNEDYTPPVFPPLPAETAAAGLDTLSEGEKQYLLQTGDGVYAVNEKGTAAFFKGGGGNDDIYFAFHNIAPKGTIIKVTNPGTAKTVYVKVIGKVPTTRQFYNAIIGISNAARAELDVRDEKAWCEISYKQ